VSDIVVTVTQAPLIVTPAASGTAVAIQLPGVPGPAGATGPPGAAGATGPAGSPGVGVPPAGTAGQVLQKNSATDFDTIWVTPAPGGVTSFNTRTGAVALTTADVAGVLPANVARTDVANTFTLGQVVEFATGYGTFMRLHNTSSSTAGDWRWNIGSPGNNDGFLLLGRSTYVATAYDLAIGSDGGVLVNTYVQSPTYRCNITGLGGSAILAWANTGGNFNGTCSVGLNYVSGTQNVKVYLGLAGGNFQVTRNDNVLLLQTSNVGATTIGVQAATAKPLVLQGATAQTGQMLQLQGKSSLQQREQADIDTAWVDSTDATRAARLVLRAWDTAAREGMRIEGTGTAPAIGFLGAAAMARPAVTGSRGGNAALASLLTALANLGLITDSTTA
jgi:hypothetical protein